jgi:hypothetical protein
MDPSCREPSAVTDLYAAAALIAVGFRLTGVEPDARGVRPTRFLFAPDDRLVDTLRQHHGGDLSVDPERYAEAVRKLRPWWNLTPARTGMRPEPFGRLLRPRASESARGRGD